MSEWPDPTPLDSNLPPIEPFREDLLPDSLRPWTVDTAERMQVPLDLPAAALVVTLGGAISRGAAIQPKAKDTSWRESANLFGGIIAPAGFLKSPVIRAVERFLEAPEARWREEYLQDLKRYAELSPEEQKIAEKPRMKRLVVNDATFEKLQEVHSENPRGLLVIRDELAGLFATFERKGHEGERQFYLTGWNGDSPYKVDRIGRGTIDLPACCLSVLGGIPPNRLRQYLADLAQNAATNDGMIQRFQVLVWPNLRPDWTYVDRPPAADAKETVQRIFDEILRYSPEAPVRFLFSQDDGVQELFVMFLEDLERRVRGNGIGSPELVSHLSKYRGLMPRLALIFEIAERAGRGNVGFVGRKAPLIPNFGGYVSFENASRAVQWCQYLESQARRIYTAFSSKMTAAQELSKKIKHREIGDTNGFFNCRDVYINGWRYLKSSELVKSAVDVLEKAAWVRSVDGSSGAKGGRPSDRYEINPKVWKMDAEEFVIESSSAGTQPTNRQNLQNLTAES